MQEGNKLSRVSAIVLDLDNTLFDATQWNIAALRHAGRVRGLSSAAVDRSIDHYLEHHSSFGHDIYNAILLGCMQSDSGANIKALHDAAGQYLGHGHDWDLYPGVRDTLKELGRRYRLALVADGPVDAQRAKVRALDLAQYIRCTVYSDAIDGVRSRRPDPRPFREMRDLLELPSNQILFVGDNPAKDFKTPRFLGFLTCRVFSGPHRGEAYPDAESTADFETTSAARLPELLAVPSLDLAAYANLPFLKQPEDTAAADLKVAEGGMPEQQPEPAVAAQPRRDNPVLLPVARPVSPASPAAHSLASPVQPAAVGSSQPASSAVPRS
ncbi:HAD hydrolase-like protein [bacterium]|nr:HAD hydrolase-like protein [bacterium]